ncbi:MAG: 5-(carboxyamino)imidazole ribonucleotide synthase, partial [Enterococcus lemanii]
AVMVNILGEELEQTYALIAEKPAWQFHYYGKSESKVGRKMGHITITSENIEQTLQEIKATKIW